MQMQQKVLAKKFVELERHENCDDDLSRQRQESKPRRWPLQFRRTHPSGEGNKGRMKGKLKEEAKPVVPLGKFMEMVTQQLREDTGDISLAPLTTMGNLVQLEGTLPHANARISAKPKPSIYGRQKGATKQRALQLLQEEREKQRKARVEQELEEREESKRIAILKERELQRQREREAQPRPPTANRFIKSESNHSDLGRHLQDMVHQTTRVVRNAPNDSAFPASHSCASSTKPCSDLSSSNSMLAMCVNCQVADRTHIAMPCMHFCFCEGCVKEIAENSSSSCPVCQTKDVVFTRVKLG